MTDVLLCTELKNALTNIKSISRGELAEKNCNCTTPVLPPTNNDFFCFVIYLNCHRYLKTHSIMLVFANLFEGHLIFQTMINDI